MLNLVLEVYIKKFGGLDVFIYITVFIIFTEKNHRRYG